MSEMAKKAREALKGKAKRMASADPHTKVDSSTWSPPEELKADVQTGMRPVSKRQYKKGGKVLGKADGKKEQHHAGRMPRKSGGKAEMPLVDKFINKDMKKANKYRDGEKHEGGMNKGGRTGKMGGGDIGDNPISVQNRSMGKAAGMAYKKGGKIHKLSGGTLGSYREKAGKQLLDEIESGSGDPLTIAKRRAGLRMASDKLSGKGNVPADFNYDDMSRKNGGKAKKMSHMEWEHSKKDLKEDKKLAKKHGMSMEKWEGSKLDEKHDKQQSTEGLKRGGEARCEGGRTKKYAGGGIFSGDSKNKIPGATGGREAHKSGGKAKHKGKMSVNILIATGHHGQQGGAPNAPVPMPVGPRMPNTPQMPPPGAGAPPPGMMPPGGPGGPAGAMPVPPMGRKSGGRTIHVIDHAAGGGEGRLEKIKAYGLKPAK